MHGRYVVYETWWDDKKGPESICPEGAKVAGYARTMNPKGSHKWVALQFPKMSDASAYVTKLREENGDDQEIEQVVTKAEAGALLDDKSMSAYLRL